MSFPDTPLVVLTFDYLQSLFPNSRQVLGGILLFGTAGINIKIPVQLVLDGPVTAT